MHPSLQHPLNTDVQPMYADISYYEQHQGFSEIRSLILRSVCTVSGGIVGSTVLATYTKNITYSTSR